MSTIQLSVEVGPVRIVVDKRYYQEAWDEYNEEEGNDDAVGTEPSDEFVIEKVEEEFESGDRDLSEEFETAFVSVRKVP